MRFYVAAPRELANAAEELMVLLIRNGHVITYNWVDAIRRNPPDDQCTEETLRREAEKDKQGVRACQVLIVLGSEKGGTGVWCEMGMALAWNRPVHYIGPFRTIFDRLPFVTRYANLAEWIATHKV